MENGYENIYHYCSEEKFESIIKSKTLWLTKLVNSNDVEETIRVYQKMWPQIMEGIMHKIPLTEANQDLLNHINSQILTDIKTPEIDDYMSAYGVCLSVNRDLMQNWKEYANDGEGLAIGFSKKLVEGIQNDYPHPNANSDRAIGWNFVIYDSDKLIPQFVDMFSNLIIKDASSAFLIIPNTLRHYRAFIKNPSFVDEREVRIVFYPTVETIPESASGISDLKKNGILHCELPLEKSEGIAISEIIIGPCCSMKECDIRKLLKKSGISEKISITKSECSYRKSLNR